VLNGLAARRTRPWIAGHFGDPPKFSPGSQMPAYKFIDQDLSVITDYLLSIPK
jgi:cbb3-type cytochrome oxidase cytochrome c subunit